MAFDVRHWLSPTAFLKGLMVLALLSPLGSCGDGDEAEKAIKIGLVTNNPNGLRNIQGFRDGMAHLGFQEDGQVAYLFDGHPVTGQDLKTTLEHFVAAEVDLIFTAGTPTGVLAHEMTKDSGIPVIFGVMADPVQAGVLGDISHPGGNMTGVKLGKNQARRLELFKEVVPGIQKLVLLSNLGDPASAASVEQIRSSNLAKTLDLVIMDCRDDEAVTRALADLPDDTDALFLVPNSTVNKRIKDIARVSLERKIPISGPSTAQIEQGALMTYGFVHEEVGAQAARLALLVLNGANPGDLPVENAESYLGLNLEIAKRIGLEIDPLYIRSADILIRPVP
ncbi:ABC transporter substrate-binding protein [Magnetospira sp. QH-2]|uniref:ABC transporter substrate-binding protein n=1 Tax=Magnetospira sp. (strain QH-2) TaxID=1288970 RepID=UPI0003E815E7|nr:ABC transporter substrate-binding protein [Magnetospira sp. QH-2]CCQ73657.1 Conserved protein of unknown function [Magnetospira sp. QH-2]